MATAVAARKPRRSKLSDEELAAHRAVVAARQAVIQEAADAISDDDPDFREFLARWGDRYSVSNLRRLWVQAPRATALHQLPTWRAMGRPVRKGEKAIWLNLPRKGRDEDKITPENPNGEFFKGASWTAMFDYAQTGEPGDDFTERAPADADPALVDEVKALRLAAVKLHPDVNPHPDAHMQFVKAWAAYEAARNRLQGRV